MLEGAEVVDMVGGVNSVVNSVAFRYSLTSSGTAIPVPPVLISDFSFSPSTFYSFTLPSPAALSP